MLARFTYPAAVLLAALFIAGCDGDLTLGSDEPQLTGSQCGLHLDEESCVADTDGGCSWVAILAPCEVRPDGTTVCPPAGSCIGPDDGGGGGTGTIGGEPGCVCPDDGVCVQHADDGTVVCEVPRACTGDDVCACLAGSCYASPTIAGLCVCE
jgi:hypothetical protein